MYSSSDEECSEETIIIISDPSDEKSLSRDSEPFLPEIHLSGGSADGQDQIAEYLKNSLENPSEKFWEKFKFVPLEYSKSDGESVSTEKK